jgi:uncharacterized membrane protein
MAADAPPAKPQRRRVRKRIWIPSVLLAAVLIAFVWLWWRGTMADTAPRNPASVSDGVVTQLLQVNDAAIAVRSAVIVDAPPEAVWRVVSDYDSHPKFVPYIAELSSSKLDDGRVRLTGRARSRIWGDWPFEIDVVHTETPGKSYQAEWNEKDKSGFAINRGSWKLTPAGERQTLLAFTKQMEVPGYPNWVVRNILLDRLGSIVRAMRDEAIKRNRG